MKNHGKSKTHSGLTLVSDSCTDPLIFLAMLALLICKQSLLYQLTNIDFIPGFIPELNFDSGLHDSKSTFHSRSSAQSGMKNGQTQPGMSCNSIQIRLNKFNSIPYDLNTNEMSSIWIETQS